jgi:hypothetical protein
MSQYSQGPRQAKFRQQIRISNSGRPTVSERQMISERPKQISHPKSSRFLPDQSGIHRFFDLSGAVKAINTIIENYEHESLVARSIAEEFFDAHKVCRSLLSRAL